MNWPFAASLRKSATISAAALALLAGCETISISEEEFDPTVGSLEESNARATRGEVGGDGIFGDALSIGGDGDEEDSGQLFVNRYLWRASIETLAFLPLASTDPYGGVIVTDWGSTPNAPDERFKVTVFISSVELRPQSMRVVVSRQVQEGSGWVEAPVADETVRALEDAILTRARQIRSDEAS